VRGEITFDLTIDRPDRFQDVGIGQPASREIHD
jgi:hypothetical protein